jgi:hypothetical protein
MTVFDRITEALRRGARFELRGADVLVDFPESAPATAFSDLDPAGSENVRAVLDEWFYFENRAVDLAKKFISPPGKREIDKTTRAATGKMR